ncbi:MAG: hypothetical protein ACREQR_14650 [Candidatus Binataceae bacterium]
MAAEFSLMNSDPVDRRLDCTRHIDSRTFGAGRGTAISSAQPDCSGQFASERVDFLLRCKSAFVIAEALSLLKQLTQFRKPPPIFGFALRVE